MVAGFITSILGGAAVAFALVSFRKGMASKSWPTAEAIILSSRVEESVRPNNQKRVYQAFIRYRYTTKTGEEFESDRITTGFAGQGSRKSQYALVDKFPESSTVQVYVSPDDPSYAILEPGIASSAIFTLVIGAVFLAIGLGLLTGIIETG